jgi:hypothetical protein
MEPVLDDFVKNFSFIIYHWSFTPATAGTDDKCKMINDQYSRLTLCKIVKEF